MTSLPKLISIFQILLGCIVCISNGSLNLIWFIFAYVILYFCNSCRCLYALVGEIKLIYLFYTPYTPSGHTDSVLAWRSDDRSFASQWLQQVLWFLARICTVQYVELRGYCPVYGWGNGQSIGSSVSDAIVRSWLWSTSTESSPLGFFSSITASSW